MVAILLSPIALAACPPGLGSDTAALNAIKLLVGPILNYEGDEIPGIDSVLPGILDFTEIYLSSQDWSSVCNGKGRRTGLNLDEIVQGSQNFTNALNSSPVYCGSVPSYTCNPANIPQYCNNGTFESNCQICGCIQGATCLGNNTCDTSVTCSEGDAGVDYGVQSTTTRINATGQLDLTDFCSDGTTLQEYYCTPQKTIGLDNTTCPGGCSSGACQPVVPFCSDSDGGIVQNTSGFVNSSGGTFSDACFGNPSPGLPSYCSSNPSQEIFCDLAPQLTEFYCVGNSPSNQTIACNCLNGECIQATSCSDTDGGSVSLVAGNVSYNYWADSAWHNEVYSDYCVNSTRQVEWSCIGGNTLSYAITDDCNCVDGEACI